MIDVLLVLPAHLRKRLVEALEAGMLPCPYSIVSLRSALGIQEKCEEIVGALEELERLGMKGPAALEQMR